MNFSRPAPEKMNQLQRNLWKLFDEFVAKNLVDGKLKNGWRFGKLKQVKAVATTPVTEIKAKP
jgi:hypothetical protein